MTGAKETSTKTGVVPSGMLWFSAARMAALVLEKAASDRAVLTVAVVNDALLGGQETARLICTPSSGGGIANPVAFTPAACTADSTAPVEMAALMEALAAAIRENEGLYACTVAATPACSRRRWAVMGLVPRRCTLTALSDGTALVSAAVMAALVTAAADAPCMTRVNCSM